jgi:hypothetical protein
MSSAAAESRAILILDATAQMSAKLGQNRKIDALKTAVADAASRMDAQVSLAVWAFGTNPAKKCEDKGELVSQRPAPAAAAALDKALSPVQPRASRAPVFGTLQAALAAAGEPKDAAISAVIVAGAGDDCTVGICGEAQKLHALYPNAKLTVLGAGMSEQPAADFTCVAKAMGGGFTAVKSATDLDKLLRQSLDISPDAKPVKPATEATPPENAKPQGGGEKQATTAPEAAPPAPPAPAEAKPVMQPAPQPEPNTVLSAMLAGGMPPLGAGVTWEIYKIVTTPTGQIKTAESPGWIGGGGQAQMRLAEGRYLVRAGYGYARAEDTIAVNGSKTEKSISLNAGTIAAEGLQAPESGPAAGVFFILSRRKQGGGLEELGRSSESPATFHVNAGEYVLSASAGPAGLISNVKVEAGKVSAVRVAFNVGTLEIKTYEAEGAANPVSAWHRIYAAAPGPGKKAAPLLTVEGAVHRVQLPAGDYRLETQYGNARVESAVSVAAGQAVTKSVVLSAGRAKISLPAGKPARVCAVYEAGADRNAGPAGRAAGTSVSFILKAGDYEVECRAQGAPAPAKPAQIHVAAGATQEAKLGE